MAAEISIHAPREGCDSTGPDIRPESQISIHAPREGCDNTLPYCFMGGFLFQSTHPVRGATHTETTTTTTDLFQSTHPVRGATDQSRGGTLPRADFNPRTP